MVSWSVFLSVKRISKIGLGPRGQEKREKGGIGEIMPQDEKKEEKEEVNLPQDLGKKRGMKDAGVEPERTTTFL
jgi:hypothetical protein